MIARRPSRESGLTLAEVFVGAMALIVVLAVLIPVGVRSSRLDALKRCVGNLQTLHRAMSADPASASAPLGSAHWTRLPVDPSVHRCPLAEPVPGRTCDYLGPARPTASLGPDSVIGCDDPDNHGEHGREGGNVLRKSGEVLTDNGPVWRESFKVHCAR
jgi:hypothetical protein